MHRKYLSGIALLNFQSRNLKPVAEYFILALLMTFSVIKGVVPGWKQVHSDFANYYVSSKLITENQSLDRLYDNAWFQQKINEQGIETVGKFSPFPPATAWMMLPLTSFSPLTAQRIFLIINLIFTLLGIILLQKIIHWKIHHCAMLVFGCGLSLTNNVAFGQVYWIMTVFTLFSVWIVRKNYPIIAGGILTTFASIKYFPIVFIGGYFLNSFHSKKIDVNSFFLQRNSRRVFISALSFGIVIIVAEFMFFGGDVLKQFINSVLLPHLDGVLSGQGLFAFQFQSWDNFLRNLFVADPKYNPSPFMDWPSGRIIFKIIVTCVVLGSMIKVLFQFRNSDILKRQAVYLSVPALAALVLLPASATYHFILLLIPIAIIIGHDLIERRFVIAALILYSSIGFIPYSIAFQLGRSVGLVFAYPRLWLISILYTVVLYGLLKRSESEKR